MFRQKRDSTDYYTNMIPAGMTTVFNAFIVQDDNIKSSNISNKLADKIFYELKVALLAIGIIHIAKNYKNPVEVEMESDLIAAFELSAIEEGGEGLFFTEKSEVSKLRKKLNEYIQVAYSRGFEENPLEDLLGKATPQESHYNGISNIVDLASVNIFGEKEVKKARVKAKSPERYHEELPYNIGLPLYLVIVEFDKLIATVHKKYKFKP